MALSGRAHGINQCPLSGVISTGRDANIAECPLMAQLRHQAQAKLSAMHILTLSISSLFNMESDDGERYCEVVQCVLIMGDGRNVIANNKGLNLWSFISGSALGGLKHEKDNRCGHIHRSSFVYFIRCICPSVHRRNHRCGISCQLAR